jgi:NADH dehydrogenase
VPLKRILVLGGGFAGLWSAIGAARKLDELELSSNDVEITLVNRDAFHNIRVRNYESDLTHVRLPLDEILGPVDIRRVEGNVDAIDFANQIVNVQTPNKVCSLPYDRLVCALGSQLVRPAVPGCTEFIFDVDTYDGAIRLQHHLESLSECPAFEGQFTVVVVGAGLTGIELACELPTRLQTLLPKRGIAGTGEQQPIRVILADHHQTVGSDMGESARLVIVDALSALGIEQRLGIEVVSVTKSGVTLLSGEAISAATVVWCGGMRANPLSQLFPVQRDRLGRIPVDHFMQARDIPNVFVAGDMAWSLMDDCHASVMSCQHSRPMGRFAGHNVVCDLLSLPMLPLRIDWYATVLDLGEWGAVHTEGWDRQVVAKGAAAKKTKQIINGLRIYPPITGVRREILDSAAPVIQSPPPQAR